MSNNTDATMGLPRVSGKRKWQEGEEVPSKVLCTSPPHALCAEDVLPSTAKNQPVEEKSSSQTSMEFSETAMETQLGESAVETQLGESAVDASESDEDFIDDEEDKDSGFIDGNSIDNSSDEEESTTTFKDSFPSLSSTLFPSTSTTSCFSVSNSGIVSIAQPLSFSSARPPTPGGFINTSTTLSNSFSGPVNPLPPAHELSNDILLHNVTNHHHHHHPISTALETTTVTSKCTGTMVTASYSGSVSSVTHDLHTYAENYRPATPAFSCSYEQQHSNTNKYMEISPSTNKFMEISPNIAGNRYMDIPNRPVSSPTPSNQSIQCDENGKSYIELGNVSEYNNNFSECTSYSTSAYHNPSYTVSFSNGNNNFNNSPNNYYNRQPYNQSFNNYNECYNYDNNMPYYYNNNVRTNGLSRTTTSQCTTPYCDVTKSSSPKSACYKQQRLSVFNMSMYKLNRFNRFPEPSLLRSVLICNTLRHIEKEFDSEGISMAAVLANHNHPAYTQCHSESESLPSNPQIVPSTTEGPLPSIQQPMAPSPFPSVTLTTFNNPPVTFSNEEKTLPSIRTYPAVSEPQPTYTAVSEQQQAETNDWTSRSVVSEEKDGINWCSVLSLSSDLHSPNSGWSSEESLQSYDEPSEKLPSLSADDVIKSFPDSRRPEQNEVTIKDLLGS